MKIVLNWILKTVVGRWVTGALVTALLSGLVYKWYDFKSDLVEEGTQVCVQAINKDTMEQLQIALAAEKSARAELTAKLAAAAAVSREARERRQALENQLTDLERQMENQHELDPDYAKWSDTPLPDGVANRLRQSGAGSDPGAVRDSTD